ncbi:hypothetical protein U9M48_018468 [Paspalum notatum var. saurae]|uniref:Uncharacterized protein n=1 Tax=Paspalum notatum var. saurae TaxID=547442 RepID=A0AAQ3TD58_PASNO
MAAAGAAAALPRLCALLLPFLAVAASLDVPSHGIPKVTNKCGHCKSKLDFGREFICCSDCSDPTIMDKNSKLGYCKSGADLTMQLKPQETFHWVVGPWMTCSSPCDGGIRYRDVACYGNCPWEGLPVHVPRSAQALFAAAIQIIIGDGEEVLFWTDKWLHGNLVAELAPNLVMAVSKKARKQCTVSQALTNRRWVTDIRGALTVQVLVEYLGVWELVDGGPLNLGSGKASGKAGHPSVWAKVITGLGMSALIPQPDGRSFSGWWSGAVNLVPKEVKKGLNSLFILPARQEACNQQSCSSDPEMTESMNLKSSGVPVWLIAFVAILGFSAIGGIAFISYTYYMRRTSGSSGFVYVMMEAYS